MAWKPLPRPVSPLAPELRWRRVFPGEAAQIGELRKWLAEMLPECGARDDVVAVAVELATNAVRHTGSGRGGLFAVEIGWYMRAVRATVADQGAPSGPRLIDDPMADNGRGLRMVHELSSRTGVTGDHRCRLVWAEVPWPGDAGLRPVIFPPCEAVVRDGQGILARRHGGVVTWFGRSTLQWWALAGKRGSDRLVAAGSAEELSELLDGSRSRRPGGNLAGRPGVRDV